MIPRFYPQQGVNASFGGIVGGIIALLNLCLSAFICVVLLWRFFTMIGTGKMVPMDWLVTISGLLVAWTVIAFSYMGTNIAFCPSSLINYEEFKKLGMTVEIITGILCGLYLCLMLTLGKEDPTGFAYKLFQLGMMINAAEFVSALLCVWLLTPGTMTYPMMYSTPRRDAFNYMPVYQLVPVATPNF